MSTYLVGLLMAARDWLLAPPLHWLLSLSLEWQLELAIFAIATVFFFPIAENLFIGRELGGEWWAERRRVREWYYYGSMEAREFRRVVNALRREADKQDRLAERLEGRGGGAFQSQILQRAASRRHDRAQALDDEADRLEALWQAIEKERENPSDSGAARAEVLALMRRLDSYNDRDAQRALAELRRFGNRFAWDSLAPKEFTAPQRERLVKLLRLMAGTSSLDEARNAYRNALRLMEQDGCDWQWEPA
jgi:hypothetical protein